MLIPGYKILTELHRGRKRIVYRGQREADGTPVILKTLLEEFPAAADVASLKREYELIKNLRIAGIAQAYGLATYQKRPVLVLEDIGGEPLRALIDAHRIDLGICLEVGVRLCAILAAVHQHNIIHKDIAPPNIVANLQTRQIQLIDFSISALPPHENQKISHRNLLEGTLAYISPEQTGRMNRAIDYRTDFYSLGVTFYEMLTGKLPFDSADPLEVVHAHIAKTPAPLDTPIPEAISNIVMKLLAKTAEERYQSARGIQSDLELCLKQWQASGKIAEFVPAQQDFSDRFQIPQKLYGRDPEIATLLAAFERVSNGASEIMLVSGYSGIGKSALVNEVHKPILRQRGYFISGKFDQFKRNIPYSAAIQAFQELVRQLLTESEDQIAGWKDRLLAALGPNGQVIVDVIPEIELIIGPQPPSPQLPPAESQNRFNFVFQRFVQVFTQKDHPLVIFWDDLQWADSATLKLLQALVNDPNIHYMFLIGAYRDHEVSAAHPLLATLAEIEKTGAQVSHITLKPLSLIHLNQFVADALRVEVSQAKPLAELILHKTEGNPFFVTQFLQLLHQEKLLVFDNRGGWVYELERIYRLDMTDNVIDLMAGKIQKLSAPAQRILKLAACIGNQFDLETLSIVNEQSWGQTADHLWEGIREGLIVPLSFSEQLSVTSDRLEVPAHRTEALLTDYGILNTDYKFLHDRVQQAAYALIPDDHKKAVHLQVGRLLLQHCSDGELEEKLFDIVNHLNIGSELIAESDEKTRLAELNLRAGSKAKEATAYKPALNYFDAGLRLLGDDGWRTRYDLAFALHREHAEGEYLCGDFMQAERGFELLLSKAQTILERAEIHSLRIIQYENMAKYADAVQAGRDGLRLLGIALPENDEEKKAAFGRELRLIQDKIGTRAIANLIDLPAMDSPEMKMSMKLLMTAWAPAYIAGDNQLTALISAKMVRLSLERGNTEASCYGYVTHAITVGTGLGDYQTGYEFGRLALAVNEKFHDLKFRAKAHHMFSCFVNFWRRPIKTCFPHSKEAYRAGLEAGDFVYATYALIHESWHAFFSGYELNQFQKDYGPNVSFLTHIKNHSFAEAQRLILHWGLNLQGRTADKFSFTDESFDEQAYLQTYGAAAAFFSTFYYVTKLNVHYLFEDYQEARAIALRAEGVIHALGGTLWMTTLCFYHGLTLAALHDVVEPKEQQEFRQKLELLLMQMKTWADNCPENFLHKYLLMAAEAARLSGKAGEAMELYQGAIQSARDNGIIQHEALANELYAKFWQQRKSDRIAGLYMAEAHYGYQQWGAQAKVRDLEQRYPQLLLPKIENKTSIAGSHTGQLTIGRRLESLDLQTVIKASQVLSGEIELARLLEKLMRIVIENAGAQKGTLILKKAQNEQEEKKAVSEIVISVPATASPQFSAAVVNYVKRTGESVVLANAGRDSRFTSDPYVEQMRPLSILCLPILHQHKLIGTLYLENNLTADAFTPDRIEVMQMLSAQAAIALENARLYEDMKQEIAERKRAEEALRAITEGTAAVTGSDFFHPLVRHLSQALGVRYAFITECTDATNTHVHTLAFWKGDDFGENVSYRLAGTPCAHVISGEVCCYPERLAALFPEDKDLVTLNAESYLGVPLRDSAGNILGHLAVMDNKPMPAMPREVSILKTFAARAGAELERKRAEEALRKSEERFRTLFESAPIGISINDAEGRFLQVNCSFQEMLGYNEDELRARSFKEITFTEDLAESKRVFGELVAGQRKDFRVEKRYRRQHGNLVWANTNCSAVRDANGNFLYTFAMVEDISERKRAEEALRQALAEVEQLKNRLQAENIYLQEEIRTQQNFEEIAGASTAIQKIFRNIEKVAPTDTTVLITGETGTGKELVGRAIHSSSNRKASALITVNCAALPSGLIESEIFGHEKGAFTGATARKKGRFELADGGTIFLDEIGELPLETQAKLLRVLQEQEFERVGGSQTIKVNVRVIAATNRNLEDRVKQGAFRPDLFYRLNIFPIHLPCLRERRDDIPILTHHFVGKFSRRMGKKIDRISPEALEKLVRYDWPGNVRELANLLERAVILCDGGVLEHDHIGMTNAIAVPENGIATLEAAERMHILEALKKTNGVVGGPYGAAKLLGLNRTTLLAKMKKLGVEK